ncbi:MAG TPA: type 1 glutamine amidotransferase domain-containing protein [Polyangia bacterium]|nr:type 1 glutamine amidotransferase domain-containing protein [Polyangia bacterium]
MRIACVLAEGFEDSEFRKPYDAFKKAGHEVAIIGIERGKTLTGERGKEKVTTELGIDGARPDDYDALFIPGGYSPDKLRADDRMVAFARAFEERPIFAVCHGPQLLLTAGLVRGRTMTAWKTVQGDLRCGGADVVDREVVVDRNLVTSRKPEDLDAFTRESLRLLSEGATAYV